MRDRARPAFDLLPLAAAVIDFSSGKTARDQQPAP
jgi:hypothetical protein